MKLPLLVVSWAALALVGASWLSAAGGPPSSDALPTVDYTFRDVPLNSMGVKRLADLAGKPIVIDFWGKN